MLKSVSQSKDILKVSFNIKYGDISLFEEFFFEKASATSMYEVTSNTIEPQIYDIWKFEAYYYNKLNFPFLKKELQKLARDNNIEIISDINQEKFKNEDWVTLYQNQLSPIETKYFFISTKLHQNKCPKDKALILIEASRAFGTGSHETTFGCIEALEHLTELQVNKIIDIGTGSGILSFAAEKLWGNAEIFACDIDIVSIEIAKENAEINNACVNFYCNDVNEALSEMHEANKFDLIISNILALPLIELSTQITRIANKNCYLILSGFLSYQMEEVKNAYQKIGFEIIKIIYKNSWVILILQLTLDNYKI